MKVRTVCRVCRHCLTRFNVRVLPVKLEGRGFHVVEARNLVTCLVCAARLRSR